MGVAGAFTHVVGLVDSLSRPELLDREGSRRRLVRNDQTKPTLQDVVRVGQANP